MLSMSAAFMLSLLIAFGSSPARRFPIAFSTLELVPFDIYACNG